MDELKLVKELRNRISTLKMVEKSSPAWDDVMLKNVSLGAFFGVTVAAGIVSFKWAWHNTPFEECYRTMIVIAAILAIVGISLLHIASVVFIRKFPNTKCVSCESERILAGYNRIIKDYDAKIKLAHWLEYISLSLSPEFIRDHKSDIKKLFEPMDVSTEQLDELIDNMFERALRCGRKYSTEESNEISRRILAISREFADDINRSSDGLMLRFITEVIGFIEDPSFADHECDTDEN